MEPTAADNPEAMAPSVMFRPSKKRKIYRQRAEGDDLPHSTEPTALRPAPAAETATSEDEKGLSVAEALRLRSLRKGRLRGVEFRADDGSRAEAAPENPEQSLVLHDAAASEVDSSGGMSRRFAPQTGMVGELVNKHM